ncbi:hypothetical protein QWY99_08620 [Flavobacterium branchiarum]|uniref:AAA+ ATPase domain-containing protein n=1 Tax=Flavobacterium branchiarum TaxID=1114870 RepID=A0ABV5FQ21_9FLAO|nr:hypothetical protein [Flavobacterium branchiarum]MDN3673109.1 hypothetical protein [Flavobacterium branchiarum]
MSKEKIKKALTVANILSQKIKRVLFKESFFEAFRCPQNKGVWFVWGSSGSGKSTFLMQLAKEFARCGLNVFYNLLEEETDDSDFIERTELVGMGDVKDKYLAGSYNYDQLCEYLDRRGSQEVVVIDSGTYFFKSFDQYLDFKKKYKNKIIIISGHAQGSNPRSELEKSIMFDAKQKVFVSGYLAACKGRTIGPNGGLFIIWNEGYEKLRGSQE